ncbi:Hypothetical protein FKW44_001146 [Caligus rogercresseyi]|uniref:Uncharacterized protein n=1 Tax=Caligus rogercresseyi TaxID=217165 RepID=A0A7T8KIG9_CALRO|nr:Hypothetical protein FKW44_001146 [Caligus rogercresseyi]
MWRTNTKYLRNFVIQVILACGNMPRIRGPLQSGKYHLMHNILDLWSEANEDSPFTQGLLMDGGPNDGGDGWVPLTTTITRS